MKTKKICYVALAADILHEGHINILKVANGYGDVVVGLLTDQAIASYKSIPYLNYEKRKTIVENIKYVKRVVPQKTLDHTENLISIKPNFVVHGDNWKKGILKNTRKRVIKILKKWNGKLIEPKYTKNISSTIIKTFGIRCRQWWPVRTFTFFNKIFREIWSFCNNYRGQNWSEKKFLI